MRFRKKLDGWIRNSRDSRSLPDKVKIHFAPLVGKVLELKRPNGHVCYVGLIKNGEKLVLHPGWHDFVSANGVSQSDLLVFKYKRGITFEVLIFDQSGSEKSFRTEEMSNGSKQIVTRDESSWPKPVNFTAQLPDSDLQSNEEDKYEEDPYIESDKMSETKNPPLTSSENSRKHNEHAYDASTAMVGGWMTDELRRNVQKLQQQAQVGNPSFAVVLKRSHVSRFSITIPSKFCSGHHPNEKAELVLRIAGSEGTWLVNYVHRSYRQELHFKKFLLDNNLRQGDVCLFELVKGAKPTTFNVHISRKK